jgi:hypothetical protein
MASALVPSEVIENKIYVIRGQKVILDKYLADLYEVKPIRLREQVKRNLDRFPSDFMFQLTTEEVEWMVSQNAIPSMRSLGGYLPYAFTEQGIAMLSSVLRSPRAVKVNIEIMRAFVKLRELMMTHKDLAHKIQELEKKYDSQFTVVFEAIRQLMSSPPEPASPRKKIGFHSD